MNNLIQFLNAVNNLKQNFKGNPQEAVQKIVAQNNIPQEKLNEVQNTATMLMKMFK